MDRRTFLKKSLQYGMGLWIGSSLLDIRSVFAAARAEVTNIRSHSSSRKLLPQIDYFRIIVNLSADCEFTAQTDGKIYRVTLHDCTLRGGSRKIGVKNPYVGKYTLRQRGSNVQIEVALKEGDMESRAYILPPDRRHKEYRLMIDTGLLEPLMQENWVANIPALENDFIFGELGPRLSTSRIVIHHVGGERDMDASAATIHRWHLQNGWSGIGYHFVIRKDGRVERGRPQEVMGAHTYHYNADSIGICVSGNFQLAQPTMEQMVTLNLLVTALCRQYAITPDSRHILGHRDLNSTECPGHALYCQLDAVRAYAQAYFRDKSF